MKSNIYFISATVGIIRVSFSSIAAASIARVIKDVNSFVSIFIIKRNDSKNLYLSNIFSIFGKNLFFLIVYIRYLLIQISIKSFNDFGILGCKISFSHKTTDIDDSSKITNRSSCRLPFNVVNSTKPVTVGHFDNWQFGRISWLRAEAFDPEFSQYAADDPGARVNGRCR
jgi:hypothetical protein